MISGGLVPDLLVTDHLMLGMSGWNSRGLRTQKQIRDVPALIVSRYAQTDGVLRRSAP